jgi:[NiFe] hydrogenase assembly HybE family chaperone
MRRRGGPIFGAVVSALPPPVLALEQLFAEIACTRMRDVPVQNTALQVQAIGFAPDPQQAEVWLGILITPWFMNLVRLASFEEAPLAGFLAERDKAPRQFGNTRFDFIGAFEPSVGAFETCSLFSPMFEFADHCAALATATEILTRLRQLAPAPSPKAPVAPSRRGFLFGRVGAPAGESA